MSSTHSRKVDCGSGGRATLTLAAVLVASFSPVMGAAQLPTVPITFRPVHDPYPTFSGEVTYAKGFGRLSQFDALGGWLMVEGERLRVSLGAASLIREGADNAVAVAGKMAYRLSGLLTLFPFESQLGVGYFELDEVGWETRQLNVPVGLAVGLAGLLPAHVVSNVEPWVGGSLVLRRSEVVAPLGDNSAVRGGAALSFGLNVGHPVGVGVHVAHSLPGEPVDVRRPGQLVAVAPEVGAVVLAGDPEDVGRILRSANRRPLRRAGRSVNR